jgi:hypothetical protein
MRRDQTPKFFDSVFCHDEYDLIYRGTRFKSFYCMYYYGFTEKLDELFGLGVAETLSGPGSDDDSSIYHLQF